MKTLTVIAAALIGLGWGTGTAWADPPHRDGPPARDGAPRYEGPMRHDGAPRYDGPPRAAPHREPRTWVDRAHGHDRRYPTPGAVVVVPPQAPSVIWGGVHYRYDHGVWTRPSGPRYVVVRPPYGVVVRERPAWATLLTIGGLAYLYANGVYYRELADRSYEVVPPPVDTLPPAGMAPERLYVYPRQGQSAEQQRQDEFECHRWAASQVGFDPSGAAVGADAGDPSRRGDYERARSACLEGRGYTVR